MSRLLRVSRDILSQTRRHASTNWHQVLGVRKTASMKEITTSYYELAQKHHPDHGGDQATFMRFHKAYKELKKGMSSVDIIADAELSNRAVPTDSVIILGSISDPYWTGKSRKIRELLGEQKFAVKGKGDAWGGFLSRIMEAPHMTDGYTEFYCLYLQSAHYCQRTNETVLEVVDFMSDKTYYIHLDEKQAEHYEFDFDDEEDDYLLISLDGIYKQIYVGRDMPIDYEHCARSTQPLIREIKEDFQYYLE